jgi:hypothetical protein
MSILPEPTGLKAGVNESGAHSQGDVSPNFAKEIAGPRKILDDHNK